MKIMFTCVAHEIQFCIREEIDLSLFPKYTKVYHSKVCSSNWVGWRTYTLITVGLSPDEVNKGKNETGMKRLEKFLKVVRENFPEREYEQVKFSNNVELPDNLKALL